jgi:hypothetical protein
VKLASREAMNATVAAISSTSGNRSKRDLEANM